MIKALLLILGLVVCSLNLWAVEKETIALSKQMIGLLQKAKDCNIEQVGPDTLFCTGITLKAQDIEFFKSLDKKKCHKFIHQLGFSVFELDSVKTSQRAKMDSSFKEMKSEFENSTKLAYIDYKLKTVLFKSTATVAECIHEVIHFYQHYRISSSDLSPSNRKKLQERLQGQLEKEIEVVENWERKGDKKKASELAAQLSPLIQLQREWGKLSDWLDEKEVYEFMMENYQKMNLQERDFDIAVSNLVNYQYALDWKMRQRVLHHANELLNKKYAAVKVNEKMKFKTEAYYNDLFKQNKISRDQFEAKVIGLRKYKASIAAQKAVSLEEKLKAKMRGRLFKNSEEQMILKGDELTYSIRDQLPYVELILSKTKKIPMLIDLGAQQSILPLNFGQGHDLSLVGQKKIQSGHTSSSQSPIIQLHHEVQLGELVVKNMGFALSQDKLFSNFGILGIDFFEKTKSAWIWDFKSSRIRLHHHYKEEAKTLGYPLLENGLKRFDALEYRCENIEVRLDTGSQVYGDFRNNLDTKELEGCAKQIEKLSPLETNQIYFSRGIDVNLGFSYLREHYDALVFDLVKGRIELQEKKDLL